MKKTAIITGASSGMGREAVFQITDRYGGLDEIWLIARREERLKEVADKLPVKARILTLDLSKDESVNELAEFLKEEQPDVKILINAAGFGKIGKVEDLPLPDETGMIDVDCRALTAITSAVLPYMSSHGRIIMFASAAAFLPQPGFAVYAAAKSYVYSFSRALNVELKDRDIAVTAVCPGPVKTEFFDVAEGKAKTSPFKKIFMAKPKKVVKKAIRDSAAKKAVSVYGLSMKLARIACKFLPEGMLMRFMQNLYTQGSDEK